MAMRFARVMAVSVFALAMLRAGRADDPPPQEAAAALFAKSEWANAAGMYEDLLKREPTRAQYHYRLAVCRLNLKDYKPALAGLEAALARGTPEGPVRYQQARAHARLGDKAAALAALEKSAAAGFAKARQLKQEADLASLRDDPKFVALVDKLEHPTRGMKGADALDHWIGEWDVYVNGQRVGGNRIVKSLDGFAVEEFWDGGGGGRGRSLFVFEAAKGRWKQLWTSDGGWIVEKVGTPIENGIYLEGTGSFANGTVKKSREYLTKNPDGSVRQLLEDWDEDSKAWKPVFDGKYVRKKDK
jgi:hypothetical protein